MLWRNCTSCTACKSEGKKRDQFSFDFLRYWQSTVKVWTMVVSLDFVRGDALYKRFEFLCCDETVPLVQHRKVKEKNAFHDFLFFWDIDNQPLKFELWLSLWILCDKMFFIAGTLRSLCKLRIFTLMVTAREKNTRNAKQAEYKPIWCQEYTVKVLGTIVKVKVYESREEELRESFGLPFV